MRTSSAPVTGDRDLLGEVNLRDVLLENANGRHRIGDITASAHANDDIHRMRFESGFAEGTFVGDRSLVSMVSDLKDLVVRKELPSLLEKAGKPWDGTPYEMNFKFFDTREVLGFLVPGLYIEKNSSLRLKVDEDGIVDGNVTSGRLALGTRFLKDFRLDFDNRNNALHADVTGSAINLGGFELKDNQRTPTRRSSGSRPTSPAAPTASLSSPPCSPPPSITTATAGRWTPTTSRSRAATSGWTASASATDGSPWSSTAVSPPSRTTPSPCGWTSSTSPC